MEDERNRDSRGPRSSQALFDTANAGPTQAQHHPAPAATATLVSPGAPPIASITPVTDTTHPSHRQGAQDTVFQLSSPLKPMNTTQSTLSHPHLQQGNPVAPRPIQPASLATSAQGPVLAIPLSRSPEKWEVSPRSVSETRHESRLYSSLPQAPAPLQADSRPPASEYAHAAPRTTSPDLQAQVTPIGSRSGIDWIVPVEDKPVPRRTVGERLAPTLAKAHVEREKYAAKAKMTGYALNAAIGLQVLLGTLTTGLSVAFSGKQAAVSTTILGGMSTIVASYLARARGSNEPELSISRVKDLEQFIRECESFQMDQGHIRGGVHEDQLLHFRSRFEELLGNASG
ncbi:hypothetical protein H0H81_002816 [Sphagnurus paluster]|uniref:SMODS and SLOG-associating 2TM effector domain-containing protein n=1 Tax=Sphagnurus paluster TaxID=117069 RepID=A0A9P7KHR4_9AGAR|nr:hypothetical protein H0H81_002816 [Sphagnurus paluster]